MNWKLPLLAAVSIIAGFLILAGWRFSTYTSNEVHYHANFSLYVNGKRDLFKGPSFYEEEVSCDLDQTDDPQHRSHMHDGVNDVIHVHDSAVTWGNFFQSIGYEISPRFIATRAKLWPQHGANKVSFILNGQPVEDIANMVIGSEDRLLINYGHQSKRQLMKEFNSISHSAKQYNQSKDPASCGGSAPTGWHARWHHIFN